MNIYLKIIKHITEEHSVIFRYYTDVINEEFLAHHDGRGNIERLSDGSPARCRTDSNLNIFDSTILSEDELKKYIVTNAPPPISWFELQEKIQKNELSNSADVLSSAEGKTFTFTKEELTPPAPVDVEQLLNQLLSADTVEKK